MSNPNAPLPSTPVGEELTNVSDLGGTSQMSASSAGQNKFELTAAMTTVGQLVKLGAGVLARIENASLSATPGAISAYDSATVGGIAASNLMWSGIVPISGIDDLEIEFTNGLVVIAATTVTANVTVTYS